MNFILMLSKDSFFLGLDPVEREKKTLIVVNTFN